MTEMVDLIEIHHTPSGMVDFRNPDSRNASTYTPIFSGKVVGKLPWIDENLQTRSLRDIIKDSTDIDVINYYQHDDWDTLDEILHHLENIGSSREIYLKIKHYNTKLRKISVSNLIKSLPSGSIKYSDSAIGKIFFSSDNPDLLFFNLEKNLINDQFLDLDDYIYRYKDENNSIFLKFYLNIDNEKVLVEIMISSDENYAIKSANFLDPDKMKPGITFNTVRCREILNYDRPRSREDALKLIRK